MISNERSSPRGGRFHSGPGARPHVVEDIIKTDKVQIERKLFLFTLRENPRGRFLRITEDVGSHRDSIIIPASGLTEFRKSLDGMIEVSASTPAKSE
ncbi:MAG: RNA-binding protein [Verrucomicrobia bacterium]|nr:RNA-binding protein [Verrucomicrobiota bacterium]